MGQDQPTSDILYQLIEKYRRGDCSPQETALLLKWLDATGQQLPPVEDADTLQLSTRLRGEIWAEQERLFTLQAPARYRKWRIPLTVGTAAAVLVAALYRWPHPAPVTVPIAQSAGVSAPVAHDSVIMNTSGHKHLLRLPDGTAITLWPRSTLHLPVPWPAAGKDIRLNGEALFEIAPDAHHRFSVNTKRFTATVLGTVFKIIAYDSAATGRLQLISGRVMVHNRQEKTAPLYLSPGDSYHAGNNAQRLLPAEKTTHALKAVAPEEGSFVFKDSIFHFNNTPLNKVFNAISHQYGISITYASTLQLQRRKYTGDIKTTKSLDDILVTLAALNDLHVDSTASGYFINKK
ncbi:FecR family protein [Chitinophaga qingshengii]|uniref:FecR family protein n=1 Tax=Chitinophaga qingshengii TaxID=1569794 RepID=A0ABR7THB9_9BACT|nr:FecR family protein [Chitinophaga qingshengii]MBC9929839.1 FecR family protein [Chitinophaga qingshengii]